ncbi:MAG: type II secretion system minor pseudopilin GspK [Pseudomonadota bacterium]
MKQQGVALITVLSVLAVIATLSTATLLWQQTGLQRTEQVLHSSRMLDYMDAMAVWAETILLRDQRTSKTDTLQESWALRLAPLPFDQGMIRGDLEDMQGRFNLNNLVVNGKYRPLEAARLQRLLVATGIDAGDAEEITHALRDWLDVDQDETLPGGAEDYYYLALTPARRSADQPLLSATELLLVRGMTPEIWQKISPYVVALPGYRPVNVNTAPRAVLLSLSDDMTDMLVEDILDRRLSDPFVTVDAFLAFRKSQQLPNDKLPELKKASLSVASQFFLLRGSAQIAEQVIQALILIQRNAQDAIVIQRSSGSDL